MEYLSVKEIVKLYRNDVKAAQKEGKLPKNMKVSVRIYRGNYIGVRVTKIGFDPRNPTHNNRENIHFQNKRFTEEGEQVLKTLHELLDVYNYDNSDVMTDYFDVNFYSSVEYAYELEYPENI